MWREGMVIFEYCLAALFGVEMLLIFVLLRTEGD
jgi:hypothetical protein